LVKFEKFSINTIKKNKELQMLNAGILLKSFQENEGVGW